MAFLDVHFYSQCLEQDASAYVLMPEPMQGIGLAGHREEERPYPVLWLLHGMSDDHTIWQRRTSIERHVAGRATGARRTWAISPNGAMAPTTSTPSRI